MAFREFEQNFPWVMGIFLFASFEIILMTTCWLKLLSKRKHTTTMTRSHINALGNGTCPVFKMKKPNRDFLRDTVLSWLLWEFEVFHIPGDPSCGETVKTLTKLSSQSLFSHLCVSLSFPSREALVITKYKLWMGKNNCPDQICPKLWRQLLRIILKTLSNTSVQGSQQINNLVNQSLFFF